MSGRYQHKDKLYNRAKDEGFRSRAAFKLTELNNKYKFLKRGAKVIDLGAAPGGWLQVAASLVGSSGVLVGVDLEVIEPFSKNETGAAAAVPVLLKADLRDMSCRERIKSALNGEADVVLSDMSPKLSGVRDRDLAASCELVELAVELVEELLRDGGWFVAKVFPGAETDALFKQIAPKFKKLHRVTLKSSRATSNELYFVGEHFKGSGKK